MSFPKLVPPEAIEKIRADEEVRQKRLEEMAYDPRFNRVEVQQARERKERFLKLLSQCMSPKLACKQLGISTKTYRHWRSTDSWFCEELNHVIQDWKGELVTSAIGRAIGYVRLDKETGEIEADAQGKIIRHGASDRLAINLLNAEKREQDMNANITINLNMGALGITDCEVIDGQLVKKDAEKLGHLPSNMIEVEVGDAEPIEVPDE
jgi:hypothetical protein